MPEINLLQTRIKDHTLTWQRQVRLLMISLAVILLILAAAGGGLFFLSKRVSQQAQAASDQNVRLQSDLNQQQKNIGDAKTFQAQVANIKTLLGSHIYLSPLFEELSKMTYNKAQYVTLDAQVGGKLHLEGQVDSYTALAKLILGLSTSKQFQDVKLLSINPATGKTNGYVFSIDLTPSTELFLKTK